ncbi:sigma-70 family RNA polymerase sigma factor [Niallia sp. 03091]|uniref:sigma-70 family RNA polymerase sigma factor n=1 Tax=unclassified Niallia TaxID=2837522 RepID=UPI0040450836
MRVLEENVVQHIKLKNEESINFVLQTYGGLLNAIIRKYLQGNQQDIEECLADVLVSIWFHIHSFDPAKNEFKQWIAAIAKYRAIDYVRKAEKEKKYASKFEWEDKISGQSVLEPCMFDMESMLNELSDVERTIFEKYYVEGVPSREIATHFQAKESWVHNKLSRGRKKLKSILLKNEV